MIQAVAPAPPSPHQPLPQAIYRVAHWSAHCGSSRPLTQIGRGPLKDTAVWIITTGGLATIDLNGPRYVLEPGSILPLRGHPHGRPAEISHRDSWSYILIALRGSLSRLYFEYLSNEYGFSQDVPLDAEPVRLAASVADELAANPSESEHHWSNRAHQWLVAWNRYLKTCRLPLSSVLEIEKGDPCIMEFAHRSVKEIIQASGCSRTLISRRFRDKWGLPLAHVLHAVRIYQAALYLKEGDLKVKEIALKVGYASLSAFINAFKKSAGLTPLEYRKAQPQFPLEWQRAIGHDYPDLASLKRAIETSKKRFIASQQAPLAHSGMEVSNIFERRYRPARPYFNLGLCYQRDSLDTPVDMSLEPFRRKCFFNYTLAGSALARWEGQERLLQPGDLIVHYAPIKLTYFSPSPGADTRWKRYTLALFGQAAFAKFDAVVARHGCLMRLPAQSEPIRLLARIIDRSGQIRDLIERSCLVYDFLSAWHQYLDTQGNPLRNAIHIDNCDSRIIPYHTVKSVKELAEEVGYSRSHFSRKLRQQWQTATPGRIIRSGKLGMASKLLRDTDLPISQIAAKVGYASVAGFIGAFKRAYHQTPLRYRRAPE